MESKSEIRFFRCPYSLSYSSYLHPPALMEELIYIPGLNQSKGQGREAVPISY